MDYHSCFKGLKVIDLSGGVAGPSCAMMLAQHGADVIKVETPHGGGDWARILGKTYETHSSFSLYGTLGKRSLAMDLKTEEGKAILWKLIEEADVFIEGFRPGTIDRYGFGYEAVSAKRPGIIYYSISGFGQTGPWAGRPAMDPVLQAFCGIVDENRGEMDNHPHRIAISLIDMFTGLLGFQAIATSVFVQKQNPGMKGRYIECSLMHGGALLSVIRLIAGYMEGGVLQRMGMPSGVFDTADGQINITMIRDVDWKPYCAAIEREDLLTDPRFETMAKRRENIEELYATVRPVLKAMKTSVIAERLTARNIMNGHVNSYSSFLQEEQVVAANIIAWLQQPGVPKLVPTPNIPGLPPFENGTKRAHAPALGEHNREILAEYGYSAAEIEGFYAKKVVGGVA